LVIFHFFFLIFCIQGKGGREGNVMPNQACSAHMAFDACCHILYEFGLSDSEHRRTSRDFVGTTESKTAQCRILHVGGIHLGWHILSISLEMESTGFHLYL
jgi:hypothetical protein